MLKLMVSLILVTGIAYAQVVSEGVPMKRKTYSDVMPKDVVDLYVQNAKSLKESGLEKKSLKVGKSAPDLSLNLGGKKLALEQIYGAGPLVLKFYRGGWCSSCLKELKDYESLYPEFKKAGAQVIAISPDSAMMSKKTAEKNHFSFDIVSDEGHQIAKAFGLVYKENPKILEHMKKAGINLNEFQGKNEGDLVMPGTYVLTEKGIVAFSFVDADFRVRAEPSSVLEVVQQLKKLGPAAK